MSSKSIQVSSGVQSVDDLSAPTILVDAFSGVIASNGVVVIGCTQTVLMVESDQVMTPMKKVVLRLAVPAGSLPAFADFFQSQVKQMISDGVLQAGGGVHQDANSEE